MYQPLADGGAAVPVPALIESADWRALGPVRRGVARIALLASSNTTCGVPGYVWGKTLEHEPIKNALPIELRDVYTQEQFTALRRDMENLVQWTACPFVPAICFPVPIVGYLLGDLICQFRRQSHMGALLQRENERLAAEGLRWRETVHFHMQAQFIFVWDLQWIPEARPQWEIAHPHRRAISREPYPARLFFSVEETRQVDHMSLVVQHQLRAHKLRAQERLTRTPSPFMPSAPSPPPRPLSPQESHPGGGAASGAFEQPAPAQQSMDATAGQSMPRPRPQQCGACGAVRLTGTPQVAFYCHHCGTPFPSAG